MAKDLLQYVGFHFDGSRFTKRACTSPLIIRILVNGFVNGKYINRTYFIEFVQKHQDLIQEIKPSFFEITVALAFKYFADKTRHCHYRNRLRWQAGQFSNVITPMMSIITNIGYDHQNLLGNTLPKIATQKKLGSLKKKYRFYQNSNRMWCQYLSEKQSLWIAN